MSFTHHGRYSARIVSAWMGLVCAGLCLISGPLYSETLRITNGEWPPYLGKHLPHHGIASHLIEEAFAQEGIQIQWEFYPWPRSLALAERGLRDGSAVWAHSPQRDQQFYFSEPIITSRYVLFHRKDYPFDWQNIEDLAGHKLGAAQSYDYGEAFQQAERDGVIQVSRQTNELLGLQMLLAHRLDLYIIDQRVAQQLMQDQLTAEQRSQLTFNPRPVRSSALCLILGKHNPANAQRIVKFNQGLAKLRAQGVLRSDQTLLGD